MFWGAIWCSGGILVTGTSYLAAWTSPFGGTYIIAYGAIIFGAIRCYQGWRDRESPPSSSEIDTDTGYEVLALGTRLEMEGRVQEALVVYQKIIEQYPDTEASRDAKKSIDSLQAKLA